MAALPFDDEAYRAAIPVTGARRRGRAARSSSARARARPSTSTACGAASRARAPRRSSRPTPTRSSRPGSSRDQDPDEDLRRRCSDFVAEVAPPGVTVTTTYLHGGDPSLTPTDHPATRAAARALERRVRRRARVHPRGRLDPGHRGVQSTARAAGGAARVRAAGVQRPRPQRVARCSTTSSAARGSSCGSGTSWRDRRTASRTRPEGVAAASRTRIGAGGTFGRCPYLRAAGTIG